METFRISTKKFSTKLSSSGKANRWNKDGESVIYTDSSRSLSTLELIIHRKEIVPKNEFAVMVIFLADEENLFDQILIKNLPKNWRSIKSYSTLLQIGSE